MTNMTKEQRMDTFKKHLVNQPEWGVPFLKQWGVPDGEWEDTDAEFHPDVLKDLFPRIPAPPPGTTRIAVGYGSLCACNDTRQIAYWTNETGWVAT